MTRGINPAKAKRVKTPNPQPPARPPAWRAVLEGVASTLLVSGGMAVWSRMSGLPWPLVVASATTVLVLGAFVFCLIRLPEYRDDRKALFTGTAAVIALGLGLALAVWTWRPQVISSQPLAAIPDSNPYSKLPVATAHDLSQSVIKGRRIRLVDLPRDPLDNTVRGITIEGCYLDGPAAIVPLDNTIFLHNAIEPDGFLVLDGNRISGAIGLRNCIVRNSQLSGIAICGPKDLIDTIRKESNLNTVAKQRLGLQ